MTIIAAITRKAQAATASVASARLSLSEAIAKGDRSELLASEVNGLAFQEGVEFFWASMLNLAEYVQSDEDAPKMSDAEIKVALVQEAMSLLTRGADDRWSGRGNDCKRSYFDGVREGANSLRYL